MSNTTPTPIQQAIEEMEKSIVESATTVESGMNISTRYCITILKSLLPAERKFAEKCFDAGKYCGIDVVACSIEGDKLTAPDFSTFYKKYEDGK